jgi:hypothetical protein
LRRSHASLLVECFGHEEDHVDGVTGLVLCPCLRFRPAGLCLHHGSATALKKVAFEDMIDLLQYKDADGNELPLQKLHAYPLRIFKHYMLHILEECRRHDDTTVKPFFDKCQSFTVKEYDDFRVGSAYAASSISFIRWATNDAKEYDEFRLSPEYIDSVQEMMHDSSLFPLDDAIVIKDIGKASPVSKGMEKIPESTNKFSVMSMETSKIVSHISVFKFLFSLSNR